MATLSSQQREARRLLDRRLVFGLLCLCFALAYVLVPLWRLPQTDWQRLACAIITIGLAVLWALLGSQSFSVHLSAGAGRALLMVGVLVLVWNAPALMMDVPWRGDEDFHISVVNRLVGTVKFSAPLVLIGCVPLMAASLIRWRYGPGQVVSATLILLSGLCLALVVAVIEWGARSGQFVGLTSAFNLTRYPMLTYWIAAPPVIGARVMGLGFWEISYRLVPLVSAMALVTLAVGKLGAIGFLGRCALAMVLVSIPVLHYYSSILYLELPAILLLSIVCLGSGKLLTADWNELKQTPAWYALLLLGFTKETMFVFLVVFVGSRAGCRLATGKLRGQLLPSLGQEAKVAFCVLLPALLYLGYRIFSQDPSRPYVPTLEHLLNWQSYGILVKALWQQYGVVAVAVPLGWWILGRHQRWPELVFQALAVVGYLVFLMGDRATDLYLGYSRFLLPLLAFVISGLLTVLQQVPPRAWRPLAVALLLVSAWQLSVSPVNADGTRTPSWGQYRDDTSEHYYPYRAALHHLQTVYPNERTLVTGLTYPYPVGLYTGDSPLFPVKLVSPSSLGEAVNCEEALAAAAQESFAHVLYHVLGPQVPEPAHLHGFRLARVFENSAHRLALFSRPPALLP